MEEYLIYNEKDKNEHYFKFGEKSEDIRHYIINYFDCSKEWCYVRLKFLLESYQLGCKNLDIECKYDSLEDVNKNYIYIVDFLKEKNIALV